MIVRTVGGAVAVGAEPWVDLMPPALATRVKVRGTVRWLVLATILVLLLAVLATILAAERQGRAEAELSVAQQRTAQIVAERGQYQEVSAARTTTAALEQAGAFGAATEILWENVYDQIDGRLPDGASVEKIDFQGREPWAVAPVPESVFRLPREATVTFTVVTLNVPDAVGFVESLRGIRGVVDATSTSLEQASGLSRTVVEMNLGSDALSERFSPDQSEVQP